MIPGKGKRVRAEFFGNISGEMRRHTGPIFLRPVFSTTSLFIEAESFSLRVSPSGHVDPHHILTLITRSYALSDPWETRTSSLDEALENCVADAFLLFASPRQKDWT